MLIEFIIHIPHENARETMSPFCCEIGGVSPSFLFKFPSKCEKRVMAQAFFGSSPPQMQGYPHDPPSNQAAFRRSARLFRLLSAMSFRLQSVVVCDILYEYYCVIFAAAILQRMVPPYV